MLQTSYLKFTHNVKQSQGNHYDSIIKERIKKEVICIDERGNLEMSSEVKIESPKKTKIENKQVSSSQYSKAMLLILRLSMLKWMIATG